MKNVSGHLYNMHMYGSKPRYPDHYAATVNQVHVENLSLEVCDQAGLESACLAIEASKGLEIWDIATSYYTTY